MATQNQTLVLIRTDLLDTCTIGELYYNDKFICYTLEDKVRPIKIYGETAIPYGTYKVIVNHSQRFNQLMPLLLNVPNFEGIRVHFGNTSASTNGCLLVGTKKGKNSVLYSRAAYAKVFNLINTLLKLGTLEITIIDKPVEVPEVIPTKPIEQVIPEIIPTQTIPTDVKQTILSIILNFLKKWRNSFHNL